MERGLKPVSSPISYSEPWIEKQTVLLQESITVLQNQKQTIMEQKLYPVLLAATVFASGCINIPSGGFAGTPGGQSGEWCAEGETWSSLNPTTGERVQFEVQGISKVEGRTVCTATWETSVNNSDGAARMEMQFTENGDYSKITIYSSNGTVLNEIETGSP
jgi:hypothetical protein